MSFRHRYFIDRDGPLVAALFETHRRRLAAQDKILRFMNDVGATNMYGTTPANYRFDFESAKDVDAKAWKKTKPFRGEYFFVPRRNTAEGKALAARIKQLPECPSFKDCIACIPGLPVNFPVVIEGGTGYSPFLKHGSFDARIAIVAVPWRDYPADEMEKYKRDREAGRCFSSSHDFALWTPPDWLVEIKEWEALKIIDEAKHGETA